MKQHKWYKSVFLLVLFLFFLSGCSPRNGSQKTVINFVTWKPNVPEVWEKIYKTFQEENPDIKLRVQIGPHSSTAFHDMLTQKLKNKSTDVDVFLMDVVWPPEFGSAGWAMPLDDVMPLEEREKFLRGPIIANTYKGRLYGIPFFIDSGLLFYRKDLLDAYGFKPPETWEELVKQAETIMEGEKRKGNLIYGFSGQFKQYEGLVCDMLEFIMSNGGHVLDPITGRVALADTPAINAVQFVRDRLIGKIAPKGVLTYQEPESLDLFIQGKAVFMRNWPYAWSRSNDPDTSMVAGKVGISVLPHFKGGKSFSTLGGWQIGISAFSNHKEAAIKFARFLSSERVQKWMALIAGKAPTRNSLYDDQDILSKNPHFREMKDVFLTAFPRPRSPLYPAISEVLQRYFSKAISDPFSDIKVEAESAAREIEEIVKITRGKQ